MFCYSTFTKYSVFSASAYCSFACLNSLRYVLACVGKTIYRIMPYTWTTLSIAVICPGGAHNAREYKNYSSAYAAWSQNNGQNERRVSASAVPGSSRLLRGANTATGLVQPVRVNIRTNEVYTLYFMYIVDRKWLLARSAWYVHSLL